MKNNFLVVTPAFNCESNIEQTINTVVAQSYNNWRMIVIDDVSTDQTSEVVKEISSRYNLGDKLSVVRREEKYGEVRNTYDIHENHCEENDVIVRLDGGDWITDNDCFYILNSLYNQYDPAVMWTAHRWEYNLQQNISNNLNPAISAYEHPWVSSHLKTFRKSTMDGINKQNYMDDNGDWIMIACDQAVFLPMLEKSRREKRNLLYVPMCMYHYSIDLGREDLFTCERSKNQKASAEWIRDRGYIE